MRVGAPVSCRDSCRPPRRGDGRTCRRVGPIPRGRGVAGSVVGKRRGRAAPDAAGDPCGLPDPGVLGVAGRAMEREGPGVATGRRIHGPDRVTWLTVRVRTEAAQVSRYVAEPGNGPSWDGGAAVASRQLVPHDGDRARDARRGAGLPVWRIGLSGGPVGILCSRTSVAGDVRDSMGAYAVRYWDTTWAGDPCVRPPSIETITFYTPPATPGRVVRSAMWHRPGRCVSKIWPRSAQWLSPQPALSPLKGDFRAAAGRQHVREQRRVAGGLPAATMGVAVVALLYRRSVPWTMGRRGRPFPNHLRRQPITQLPAGNARPLPARSKTGGRTGGHRLRHRGRVNHNNPTGLVPRSWLQPRTAATAF